MIIGLRNAARVGLVLGVLTSVACSNSGPMTVSDSTAYLAETSIGSLNAALTDDERSPSVAAGAGNAASLKNGASRSLAAFPGCGNGRYNPPFGATSCAGTVGDATVTSTLNCAVAQGVDQLLKGSVALSFDKPATCVEWLNGIPTSGSVTWTSSNFLRTTTDSSGVYTSSQPAKNYLGVTIGGGMKTAWGTSPTTGTTTSLNINGLHVTRQTTGNLTVFDHTVTTTGALNVTGTLAGGNRAIAAGTIVVDHNVQHYTATGAITNLAWSASCCIPTSGSINYTMSGSAFGNIIVNFETGTCGKVSVSDASVIATQSNPSPTPVPSGMASIYTAVIGGCQ